MEKKTVLWASSSVGYAHVMRDMAIIDRLKERIDFDLDLLVPPPLYGKPFLEGYPVLGESCELQSSGQIYERIFSDSRDEFDLMHFIKEDTQFHKHDCEITNQILGNKKYDLIVADEAFWILSGLSSGWIKKTTPVVYMSEFIGMKAMKEDKGSMRFFRDQNMLFMLAMNMVDDFMFVGDDDDVPDEPFAIGLPNQRRWADRNCSCIGSIVDMDLDRIKGSDDIRKELGIPKDKSIYLGIISSPSIHNRLGLHKIISSAFLEISRNKENCQFIIIDPKNSLYEREKHSFIDYLGFVDNIYEYMQMSDLVVTQSGLTKISALSILKKPFVSIPLDYHFENEFYTGIRIKRNGTGTQLLLRNSDSSDLFDKIIELENRLKPENVFAYNRGEPGADVIFKYLSE